MGEYNPPLGGFIGGMTDELGVSQIRHYVSKFGYMMTQCARSELIAQAFIHSEMTPPKSKCHINSSNLYCQGNVVRNVHLNTEYVILFCNTRE